MLGSSGAKVRGSFHDSDERLDLRGAGALAVHVHLAVAGPSRRALVLGDSYANGDLSTDNIQAHWLQYFDL